MGISFEEKLGQMFIIRMHGKKITDELIELIRDYHIGGISLYYCNYDSYDEMLELINELKRINSKYNKTPLIISLDQEGGRVNRLPDDFKNIVCAKKLSQDNKFIEEAGNIIGETLNNIGVNMNFAPVLDIQRFKDDHAIGDRCFGDNKEDVSSKGLIMMKTLKDNNIIPVVKHFPGHGLVNKDSHFFLPMTLKNIKEVEDIEPFKDAINNDCEAIMISHIMVRKLDRLYPASLSKKVIKDYLIDELKYKGLIITDDLRMKAVNLLYGYKRSSLKAITAGNDMVLIGAPYKTIKHCFKYISKKLNNEIKNNVEKSYKKIIKIKEKYNLSDKENKKMDIEKINKRIEKLNKKIKVD